jgi:hypothetical protein
MKLMKNMKEKINIIIFMGFLFFRVSTFSRPAVKCPDFEYNGLLSKTTEARRKTSPGF